MKKKLLVFAAVFMLVLSFAGQAMADFAVGDLIEVVYQSGAGNPEVAIDLGNMSALTTPGAVTDTTFNTNTWSLSNFPGATMANLNVAYFMYGGSGVFLLSGPESGQTIKSNLGAGGTGTAMSSVLSLYASLSGGSGMATTTISNLDSYYYLLDKNGTGIGSFASLVNGGTNNEANLGPLATTGYVDQYLYYYPASASNTKNSAGVQIADIRTYANGSVEIIPLVTTPLPAAFWLLGSGLVGLVGIRRRKTAV
jgi:hypothetical protein